MYIVYDNLTQQRVSKFFDNEKDAQKEVDLQGANHVVRKYVDMYITYDFAYLPSNFSVPFSMKGLVLATSAEIAKKQLRQELSELWELKAQEIEIRFFNTTVVLDRAHKSDENWANVDAFIDKVFV